MDKNTSHGKGSRRHPFVAIGAGTAAFAVSGLIVAEVTPVSANNAAIQGTANGPAVRFVPDNPPPGPPGPVGPPGPPGPQRALRPMP